MFVVSQMRARHLIVIGVLALVACGDLPLQSIGNRSSDWINEPTVVTTIPVTQPPPGDVPAEFLMWINDEIASENPGDPEAILSEIFARRQGDRFIQASRVEIASVVPDLLFPSEAPPGAEWVSSQLVFDNDGTLADDPVAAFGIWSAEPYTRSRSVAQMVVMKVSDDRDTAALLAAGEPASCAAFAERSTDQCEILTVEDRDTWYLSATGGSTVIWFEGDFRYELFGRSFIPVQTLTDMSTNMIVLGDLEPEIP